MSSAGNREELRHDVPMPALLRGFLVVCGGGAIVAATWDLWRGLWPLNAASLFFALIVAGAWAVGLFFIAAGLLGRTVAWRVTPGRIEIETRNPFRRRRHRYGPADIAGFSLREIEWDSRGPSWRVTMAARDGRRHETRDLDSRDDAESLKRQIEAMLAAAPAPDVPGPATPAPAGGA